MIDGLEEHAFSVGGILTYTRYSKRIISQNKRSLISKLSYMKKEISRMTVELGDDKVYLSLVN